MCFGRRATGTWTCCVTNARTHSHPERPFGLESFVAEFKEKLRRRWKRWTFDKELVDSGLTLILDQIAPKAASAS